MASYVVGIDYLLDGSDSDSEDAKPQKQEIPPKKEETPPKKEEEKPKESEKKQEPELSGMQLLKSMYAKEEARQRSASAHSNNNHKKHVKLKIKIGTPVDIYSASRKQWVEGKIKEIKGDTLCILYGKKMKWLHKTSKNFRPKQQLIADAAANTNANAPTKLMPIKPSSSPPAAFSSILMEDMKPQVSYDAEQYDEVDPIPIPTPEPVQQPRQPAPPIPIKQRNMSPSVDHYEYDVTFVTASLGLMLGPVTDGINCLVKKCMSQFAMKNVDVGSIVCAINGKNVMDKSYQLIRDMLKQNAAIPPLTVSFRAKINGQGYRQMNNVNERGLLQIKVVGCIQLKHAANYVGIRVGNAYLTTKQLGKSDHHPEWMEVMSFKNFRCDHGKFALITVYNKSSILKDKKIGTCKYVLPIKFNSMQKDTLELKNDKGKICGCIMLNAMVVPPR